MQLPRFLWVPFELGRPFGAPNEPAFQKRVLHTALELLNRTDGPVILDDFPDDAPVPAVGTTAGEEAAWACPITFPTPTEEHPELVAATLGEMARLEPWYETYLHTRDGAGSTVSPSERRDFVAALGEVANGTGAPELESDLALQEWIRLGCDDLCNWYLDAARGQPGRGTPRELRDWFWLQTAAARLIASAARTLQSHPDPMVQALAMRAMVPREYLPELEPEIGAHSWREK